MILNVNNHYDIICELRNATFVEILTSESQGENERSMDLVITASTCPHFFVSRPITRMLGTLAVLDPAKTVDHFLSTDLHFLERCCGNHRIAFQKSLNPRL